MASYPYRGHQYSRAPFLNLCIETEGDNSSLFPMMELSTESLGCEKDLK